MINDEEIRDLKEEYDDEKESELKRFDIDVLDRKAEKAKRELQKVNSSTDLNALETEIIKTQQEMKFMAKYSIDEQVSKNFKTLQQIIDDEPTYEVYETPNGAKTVRTSGTDNKDRLTALGTFFKYNLKTPDSDTKSSQHIHLHNDGVNNLISNLLRGKEKTAS